MAAEESNINLFIRADMETYCPETLVLIPENLREDYARIMKQLAHVKAIAAIALEQVYLAEEERHAFFTLVQKEPARYPLAEIINLDDHR